MSGDLGVSSQDERLFPVYNVYFLFIAYVTESELGLGNRAQVTQCCGHGWLS